MKFEYFLTFVWRWGPITIALHGKMIFAFTNMCVHVYMCHCGCMYVAGIFDATNSAQLDNQPVLMYSLLSHQRNIDTVSGCYCYEGDKPADQGR